MIKGNESDVGNIDFELQAKRGDKFLYFTLFLTLKNCSYRCNQCSIEMGFESRCSILNGQVIYIEKTKLKIADMWLIPLDHVTNLLCVHMVWQLKYHVCHLVLSWCVLAPLFNYLIHNSILLHIYSTIAYKVCAMMRVVINLLAGNCKSGNLEIRQFKLKKMKKF